LNNFIPKDQYDKLDLIDYAAIGLEFALSGEGEPPETVGNPAETLRASLSETKTEANNIGRISSSGCATRSPRPRSSWRIYLPESQ